MQVVVRCAAVGGRRGDPRRQGQRSGGGAGALRNLWQNMWRNNGEGESSAEFPPGYQVRAFNLLWYQQCIQVFHPLMMSLSVGSALIVLALLSDVSRQMR